MDWSQLLLLLLLHSSSSSVFEPLSYDLYIRIPEEVSPDVSFSASLSLHIRLLESSSILSLHSVHLSSFRNVTLVGFDQIEYSLKGIRITDEHVEFMYGIVNVLCGNTVLRYPVLSQGEYILHIGEYVGRVGEASSGVFVRGQSLYTHLQPSFARRLLPCIDEPDVRAPLRLTIQHSQTTRTFSNTGSVEERLKGDRRVTIFSTTPSLPMYLLAFSVLPQSIHQMSGQTTFGVTVRIIGDKHSSLSRVLRYSIQAFEYLSHLMRIPLPLNKMDILLVDSYEGGMENWGHILISSSIAHYGDDSHLVHLLAHELAHHWIGNLASLSTWSHICLQEDLTELVAHKTVKNIMKREEYDRFRLAKYIEIQLAEDIVSPLHPLILPSHITPQMIWTHCYLKGIVHLEMIESLIGEDRMFSIIRSMITSNSSFDLSTFTSHLSQFTVQDNITLSDVYYHSFTTGGYPSVDVSITDSSIRLDQSGSSLWPLSISFSNGSSYWLLTSSHSLPRHSNSSSLDYLVNTDFNSFIRVNYDNKTWKQIIYALETDPTRFSPVGRAQLVSDLCFFSPSFVDSTLVERMITVVNEYPQYFDLCDWSLLWCRNSQSLSTSSVLQKVLVNLSSIFTSASDYKCRSGQAILAVNRLCRTFFGGPCL